MPRIRRPLWIGCLALLCLGAMIRIGQEGARAWQRLHTEQAQLLVKLSRLQGWVAVGPTVSAAADELFGAGVTTTSVVLEHLSRQARNANVRVTELKPRVGEIELGLEGTAPALGAYLQEVASHRPPLRVESLNLLSQPQAEAPVLMRVVVQIVGRGEGS